MTHRTRCSAAKSSQCCASAVERRAVSIVGQRGVIHACTHGVPIVALNVQNANLYNYAAASNFLMNFDRDIDIANLAQHSCSSTMVLNRSTAYLLSGHC